MISSHNMIYNSFGSGMYHKPNSILRSKSQGFYNKNICLFSVNYTRMAGYFMGMYRDMRMWKFLQATILSE